MWRCTVIDQLSECRLNRFTAKPAHGSHGTFRCLSLDLEVSIKDRRIRAFAGVRPDTGDSLTFPVAGNSLGRALAKLDDLARGSDFLLGHNLIEFDLPHLKAAGPNLRLLRLPRSDSILWPSRAIPTII